MIYQFNVVNKKVFEMNGNRYKRRFRVTVKNFASAIVSDVFTGHYLGTFQLPDLRIDGLPVNNWAQLEAVVYNFECVCDGDDSGELRGRIFDDTFGLSFE